MALSLHFIAILTPVAASGRRIPAVGVQALVGAVPDTSVSVLSI
jgi:hypothetical protein